MIRSKENEREVLRIYGGNITYNVYVLQGSRGQFHLVDGPLFFSPPKTLDLVLTRKWGAKLAYRIRVKARAR